MGGVNFTNPVQRKTKQEPRFPKPNYTRGRKSSYANDESTKYIYVEKKKPESTPVAPQAKIAKSASTANNSMYSLLSGLSGASTENKPQEES